jgi:hypothetical protein
MAEKDQIIMELQETIQVQLIIIANVIIHPNPLVVINESQQIRTFSPY